MQKKREKKHGDNRVVMGSASKTGNTVIKDGETREKEEGVQTEDIGILMEKTQEVSVAKGVTGELVCTEAVENVWFTPGRLGRSQSKTPRREEAVVQISASKYSVLSVDDAEEGEVLLTTLNGGDEVSIEEEGENETREEDLLEDEILEQITKENEKVGVQKGGKRVQKTRTQDVNPKSKRSSRLKL